MVSAAQPELLERRPAWGDGATVLDALAGDEARRLLDALPERIALDERLATAILDAAEGVPLFLEQLAAHAAESDLADGEARPAWTRFSQAGCDHARDGRARGPIAGGGGRQSVSRESLDALNPDRETRSSRPYRIARAAQARPHARRRARFAHPLVRGASSARSPP